METLLHTPPTQAGLPQRQLDKAWWDHFISATKGFTATVVIPDVLPATDIGCMNALVMEVLEALCRYKTNAYGFRVFIDGQQQDNKFLDEAIYPLPPLAGEDISSWSGRVFGDRKFGMIINYAEKFSPLLAQALSSYIQPLLDITGIPLNGLHTTTFIGNYGYTPLGIHQDHEGGNVIHFHLGPGPKVMYNWDAADYQRLAGGRQNNTDVAPLLPHAAQYAFKAGDLYYMPWNKYHVGYTGELSVGVTVWFDNHQRGSVLEHVMEAFKRQYLNMEDITITAPETAPDDFTGFSHVEGMLKLDERLEGHTFQGMLKETYKECMYAMASNGGWRAQPLSLERAAGYNENDYSQLQGRRVRLVAPYRLYHLHDEERAQLRVFVRAAKIEIRYHSALVSIIHQLNTGEACAVDELVSALPATWPEDAGLYFLSLIYNRRGIEIV